MMKEFLLEGLLYPFLAISFCPAFGIPFTYAGFQTIHLEGTKMNGSTSMHLQREHFWGLYRIEEHIEGVTGAVLKNDRFRQAGYWRRAVGVHLVSQTETVRVIAGSSDVDDKLKREIINSVNDFVDNPGRSRFDETYHIHNVFGWFGLPFLILGILGLVGWPGSIFKRLRD
jgi:hypothetical protein